MVFYRYPKTVDTKGESMARYKEYNYHQGKMIPISFDKQILPGTFEHTLS